MWLNEIEKAKELKCPKFTIVNPMTDENWKVQK